MCKKKYEMIRSVSLTAKKMLDMKQIFVVLTNPVYPALFSVLYREQYLKDWNLSFSFKIPMQNEVFSLIFLSNLLKIKYSCRYRGMRMWKKFKKNNFVEEQ